MHITPIFFREISAAYRLSQRACMEIQVIFANYIWIDDILLVARRYWLTYQTPDNQLHLKTQDLKNKQDETRFNCWQKGFINVWAQQGYIANKIKINIIL